MDEKRFVVYAQMKWYEAINIKPATNKEVGTCGVKDVVELKVGDIIFADCSDNHWEEILPDNLRIIQQTWNDLKIWAPLGAFYKIIEKPS